MKTHLRNSITGKVILRLLAVELAIMVVFLLAARFILMPRLRDRAIQTSTEQVNTFASLVESRIDQYVNYSQLVINTASLREYLQAYKAEPTEQNKALLSLALTEQFSNSSSIIRGVLLQAPDGTTFHSVANLRDIDFAQIDSTWYQSVSTGKNRAGFGPIYDPGVFSFIDSVAYSRGYYVQGERYSLTLFLNCSDLTALLDATAALYSGLSLVDEDGAVIYVTGEMGGLSDFALSTLSSMTPDGIYYTNDIDLCSWRLTLFETNELLMSSYHSIVTAAIVLFLSIGLITAIVSILVMSHTIRPIRDLTSTMREASGVNMDIRSQIQSGDEIEEMSHVFNQMLANLQNHMEQEIAFETNAQKMRYNLLLSQLDSHFIGNTMSTINAMVRQGKTSEVIALNTALLKIIQNNLRIRELDVTDTIAQEMEVTNQYWSIVKLRSDNYAELSWDVPDELLEELIPKNILQPLVENCLFHGLIDNETGEIHGEIRIHISGTGAGIQIDVQDNGCGIDEETLASLNDPNVDEQMVSERGRHIGLRNIRQRLQYLYGRNCLSLTCAQGTTVTLTIPNTV